MFWDVDCCLMGSCRAVLNDTSSEYWLTEDARGTSGEVKSFVYCGSDFCSTYYVKEK